MIGTIVATFIMVPFVFLIWHKWKKEKVNWRSLRFWIISILSSTIVVINYFTINPLIRTLNIVIIFIITYMNLFKTNLKNSLVNTISIEILYIIAETIYSLIVLSILGNKSKDFIENFFGTFFSNLSISFMVLILSKRKILLKIKNKFEIFIDSFDEIKVLFFSCVIALIYSLFAVNAYYHLESNFLIMISLIISCLIIILLVIFINTKHEYYKLSETYNSSLLSLKELENALTNHRIDNHENKNHLMTIRNMTKNKKVNAFIDSILDNKLDDDKRIMQETSIIPSGGLRGLIYSKLLLMSSKSIEYDLDIESSIRVVDILDFGDSMMLDICKILGIYLDNAIEEMDNVDDKYIIIEMYKENDVLRIAITNTYDNSVDKTNIDKAGVTTKGGNHGYGLSLVKKIIKNNNNLKTYNEISEKEFSQILEIYK